MASMFPFRVVTVILWLQQSGIIAEKLVNVSTFSRLTLDPPYIYVTPTMTDRGGHVVTMRCDETGDPTVGRLTIAVGKYGKNGRTAVAYVHYSSLKPTLAQDPSVGLREVNGSYKDHFLEISFVQPVCGDEAVYDCISTYFFGDSTNTKADITTLYLPVNGPLTMTVSPEGRTTWDVDDEITLKCTGPAPKDRTRAQIELLWKFRNSGTGSWFPFDPSKDTGSTPAPTTGTSPTNNNTPVDPSGVELFAETPGNFCSHAVSEVMRFRLMKEDEGREFRCYILLNNVSYPEYGDSVTIASVVGEEKPDRTRKPPELNGKDWKGGGNQKKIIVYSWSIAQATGLAGMSAGGIFLLVAVVGVLAKSHKRCRPHRQPAGAAAWPQRHNWDTYQQQGHRWDTDHASHHASAPDESTDTGSNVSVSMSQPTNDTTTEEPTGTYTSGQSNTSAASTQCSDQRQNGDAKLSCPTS